MLADYIHKSRHTAREYGGQIRCAGSWGLDLSPPSPGRLAALDGRGVVRAPTGINASDDPNCRVAGPIIDRLNAETESYWRGLADGQAAEEAVQRASLAIVKGEATDAKTAALELHVAKTYTPLELIEKLEERVIAVPDRLSDRLDRLIDRPAFPSRRRQSGD